MTSTWFLGWSVPLSLATIPIARMIVSREWRFPIGLASSGVLGLMLGVAWSYFLITVIGRLIDAASIPFLDIWPFAAAAGIAAELGFRATSRKRVAVGVFLIAMTACLLAAIESQPYLAGWQDRVDIFPANTPLHRWRLRFDNQFERSINVMQEHAGGWSGGGVIRW